jgi:DNA-binding IclR family transcriptional regulator
LIRPELRKLVEATTETASYFVREGDTRVCLYRQNSPRGIRHHLAEGQRLTLQVGAIGKVFAAYCEDLEGDPVIREAGYAYSEGERDPEVAAVAVPVLDTLGHIRGALSISGLVTRFIEAKRAAAVPLLKESAARLSRAFTTEK